MQDVFNYLWQVKNLCERRYGVTATIERTRRQVPYVALVNGRRVVYFVKDRAFKVYSNYVCVGEYLDADLAAKFAAM